MPTAGASIIRGSAEDRLETSVAAALSAIAQACRERQQAPVHSARRCLAEAYGAARLRKRMARDVLA